MKDYCSIKVNKCDTVEQIVSHLHGVVCVMNRYFMNAQSQSIFEMFIQVHYKHWTKKSLFDFLVDLMILTEDNSIYQKMLYHVRNRVQDLEN